MGIVRSLPDVESWLSECAESWEQLSDPAYRALLQDWMARFRLLIQQRRPTKTGDRALACIAENLPVDVLMFSGVRVPEVANMGGTCAAAYRANGLTALNVQLLRNFELLVVSPSFAWCCLFSHETGSMCHEELYGSLESVP